MATGSDRREKARREAARERREDVRAMTPGERMELAYRLYALRREDG